MNVKDYISSGILEAYVMGELTSHELVEVEKAIAEHPEIREELKQIEQALESLSFASSKVPPEKVKSKLFESVSEETKVVSLENRTTSNLFIKYAVAASVTLTILSSVLAYNFWNKWKDAEGRLSDLITQNQQFAENYNMVNQQLDGLQEAVGIMNNPDFVEVRMGGTDNSPESLATVYWNKTTSDVYLGIQSLKDLSEDQQYQLWAIIDGKPVDAGVFDVEPNTILLSMRSIGTGAAAFAVTIEPKGGSENPTLATMQVLGEV